MPALEKTTNLYAAVERVAEICKRNKMNLSAEAMAAALVETIANEIADKAGTAGQNTDAVSWFMDDAQRKIRGEVATGIAKCVTAAKNFQNSYAYPSGLMPKAESSASDVEFA